MYFLYSFKLHRVLLSATHKSAINVCGALHKSDAIDVDVVDVFTSNLVKNKNNKWERFKLHEEQSFTNTNWHESLDREQNNISVLSVNQVDNLIAKLMQQRNFKELSTILHECTKTNKLLGSHSIALITDKIISEHNEHHVNALLKYFRILEERLILDPEYYYIIIEFYWNQGYFKKCLDLMTEYYHKNDGFCKICNNFMRYTIIEKIDEKSEAVLIHVIKFCEAIASNYDDYSLLALIWLKCLRSHQCVDHNFALKLFESHVRLRGLVLKNIRTVCSSLLYEHNIEAIYRLIEILLKNDLKSNCDLILVSLFEYHCKY